MGDTPGAGPPGWPELRDLSAGGALAQALSGRSLSSLDCGELVDVVAAAKRLQTYFDALGLSAADLLRRQLAASDPHGDADSVDPTPYAAIEVAAATSETRHRASCRLHLVRTLSEQLPRVWALVVAGRLDVYSADQIWAELLPIVDRSLVPGLEAEIVDELIATTPADAARASGFGLVGANPTRTRALVRRLVARAQPEQSDERFKRAYAQRRVSADTANTDGDGMGGLWLSHSIDRVTAIQHRLGLLARSLPADDERTMDQKVADLAADIFEGRIVADTCTSLLEEGADPRFRGTALRRRIQLNVTVPIQTLMGLSDAPGETLTGQVLPASLVRQLATDPGSVWYRMLTDRGRFVELSTESYRPSAALDRSVVARDRTCVGVGCNKPANVCDGDHTLAWSDGGETTESNLGPACRSHHNSKDNGGPFRLMQPAAGVFCWTYPSGHTYTTRAAPYPEAEWPQELPIPASATDVAEGLRLLQLKSRREAEDQLGLHQQSIADRKLRQWRIDSGEDEEIPDDPDEARDDYRYIPVEVLESWPQTPAA